MAHCSQAWNICLLPCGQVSEEGRSTCGSSTRIHGLLLRTIRSKFQNKKSPQILRRRNGGGSSSHLFYFFAKCSSFLVLPGDQDTTTLYGSYCFAFSGRMNSNVGWFSVKQTCPTCPNLRFTVETSAPAASHSQHLASITLSIDF